MKIIKIGIFPVVFLTSIFAHLYITSIENVEAVIIVENKCFQKTISNFQPELDQAIAKLISDSVIKHSEYYNIPPNLILSLIRKESSFNPLARSKAGARGLMQIMLDIHFDKIQSLGFDKINAVHIDNNIQLGCYILSEYYKETGNIVSALNRYLGAENSDYLISVLGTYTDLEIDNNNSIINGD